MKRAAIFAEGMGAGAAATLITLVAIEWVRRRPAGLRFRIGWTLRPTRRPLPADYPDVCRAAGL
ncbi:MAG: hypothetical protein ABI592_15755 [Acidobacteriota bacterium]